MADLSILGALAGGAVALTGGWLALWGNARNQDRDTLRKHHGIAAAVREDLKRLRYILASTSSNYAEDGFYTRGIQIPQLHTWTQPLISELAGTAPEVVGHLMWLDAKLGNLKAFASAIDRWRDTYEEKFTRQQGLESPRDVVQIVELKRELKKIDETLEQLHRMYKTQEAEALEHLGKAEDRLEQILSRPLPTWWPKPEDYPQQWK